jgi:phosphatidylglycerophosphate synthase
VSRWLAWLPHALSLSRVALGVWFPFAPPSWWPALVAVAALTDLADGAASRLLRVSSKFGELLDPIADKLFLLGAVVGLLRAGRLAGWEVPLLAVRDIIVVAGLAYLVVRRDAWRLERMTPTWLGKLTTAGQLAYLLLLVVEVRLPWLLAAVACLGGLAGADYLRRHTFTRRG